MKSRNKKQSSIRIITLLGILLTTFFIYSCSTDGYSHTDKIKTEKKRLPKHVVLPLKDGIQAMY